MQLTRRQKSAAAIACMSVAALLVDRLFLAPPGGADAAPGSDAAINQPATTATQPPPRREEAAPRQIIARRLEAAHATLDTPPEDVRDLFSPPAAWLPSGVTSAAPTELGSRADHFLENHQLNAVMGNASGGYALIDGSGLRVGQTLDGFTLVEVRERSVILEADGVRIELSLP